MAGICIQRLCSGSILGDFSHVGERRFEEAWFKVDGMYVERGNLSGKALSDCLLAVSDY